MFKDGAEEVDAVYRLRLHSQARYYDYKFHLHLELIDEELEKDV